MDPITALNQEFVRLVKEDWSREAADRRSEQAAPAPRIGLVDRLRALVGSALVALGNRVQAPEQTVRAER